MGRPTKYSEELHKYICEVVAKDYRSLAVLCKEYERFPHIETIRDWRIKKKDFSADYAQAKRFAIEMRTEELLQMCDVDTFNDKDGVERVDNGKVQLQRLRVDTQKWLASKIAPKIYGDQRQLEALQEDNSRLRDELIELRKKLDAENKKDY